MDLTPSGSWTHAHTPECFRRHRLWAGSHTLCQTPDLCEARKQVKTNTWHSPFGAMVKCNNNAGICEPTWWGRRDRRQSSAAPVDIRWIPGAPLSSRSPGTHIQEIYTLTKQRDELRFTTILPLQDVIVSTMERVLIISLGSSYSGANKTKLCLLSFKQQATS